MVTTSSSIRRNNIDVMSDDFFIKEGYCIRKDPKYFQDDLSETVGIVHQPAVYPFARYLAKRFGCTSVIDVGCGRASKLIPLHPEFDIVGIDYGSNIQYCKTKFGVGRWIDLNFECENFIPVDNSMVEKSIVVCSDVIEHLVDPSNLLVILRNLLECAPVVILTTPERDLVRGKDDCGPPGNPSHVREWNLPELQDLLTSRGFKIAFSGLTLNNDKDLEKKTILMVLERNSEPEICSVPPNFRIVAIMTAFNEEDIIVPSIKHLTNQGIHVHLIDNWSTDSTYERAVELLGEDLVGIEKFPADGPSKFYDWRGLLERVEMLSHTLDADWFIHHDVDEIRESPWVGMGLKEGIYRVDQRGFNCIDHTCVVFHPTDGLYSPGDSFESFFKFFEFGTKPGHFSQIKGWKNLGHPISLARSGGHEAEFDGRKVFPYKFLLRHYPIRSQEHGERKILDDRKPRWHPEERAMGWHIQYDHIEKGYQFLRNPNDLSAFEVSAFGRDYIVERLSGIGIRSLSL
jgi:hypothetical protein